MDYISASNSNFNAKRTGVFAVRNMIISSKIFVIFCVAFYGHVNQGFATYYVPRPFWNVGHMVNSIPEVEQFLDRGANALELDVSFTPSGVAILTYHGSPCNCFRNCSKSADFSEMLEHLRQRTTPGDPLFRKELTLIMLDLKSYDLSEKDSYFAGTDVARKMLTHYWKNGNSGAKVYWLLCIPALETYHFFNGFREILRTEGYSHLLEEVGYSLEVYNQTEDIKKTWQKADINEHIWLSDGASNCEFIELDRLTDFVEYRDQRDPSFNISKTYFWTVDEPDYMLNVIKTNVDGIITNNPEVANAIIKKAFPENIRLATIDDNAFEYYNPWHRDDVDFDYDR